MFFCLRTEENPYFHFLLHLAFLSNISYHILTIILWINVDLCGFLRFGPTEGSGLGLAVRFILAPRRGLRYGFGIRQEIRNKAGYPSEPVQ